MSTIEDQEKLVEILKFTPRTYRVSLTGYGGEIVLGSVNRTIYEYFKQNDFDIEEYSWDSDYAEENNIDEDKQPFEPGSWHECDDLAHESGCEFSEYNYITVCDENGNEVWSCRLDYEELEKHGIEVDCYEEVLCSDRTDAESTVGYIGQSVEKGTFFDGDLELTAPFDPKLLKIGYGEYEGWCLVGSVTYMDEDIEGTDGYDTRGKSMECKFYDTGDD